MKNVFKSALLVLSLCTGFLMEAAEDLDVKVLDSQNVKVELNSSNKGDVLLLMDPYGNILFKDSLGISKSYQKTFNLELVPNGIYYLNLDKYGSLLVTTITKTEKGLLIEELSDFVFKPCYKTERSRVELFLNNPREIKTEIRVYDSYGILVGESSSSEMFVKKVFDFSQVPPGKYSVEVKIDEQKFLKALKIG